MNTDKTASGDLFPICVYADRTLIAGFVDLVPAVQFITRLTQTQIWGKQIELKVFPHWTLSPDLSTRSLVPNRDTRLKAV